MSERGREGGRDLRTFMLPFSNYVQSNLTEQLPLLRHGAILSHVSSLRHAYDTKKSRKILKHVLKPHDNRGLKSVARRLHARKSYRVNRPLSDQLAEIPISSSVSQIVISESSCKRPPQRDLKGGRLREVPLYK